MPSERPALVELRPVERTDLPIFFEQQRDPASVALATVPARDRAAFDAHWERMLADESVIVRSIRADDRTVGHALSFTLEGKRMVGYWLGREHWGRGIASEALLRLLELEPTRPVHARVAAHNTASIRVLEKAGFRVAEQLPDALEMVLGPERPSPRPATIRLAHDEAGEGDALVLIHGHPFDRSLWAPQLAHFSKRFRVIVPDLRGYGASPVVPGTVLMRELAQDVAALLDERGVERAALVGLSMGGLVAMELAIADPKRWWALALVATTAEPVNDDERRARLELAERVEREGATVLVAQMQERLFGPACEPETAARVLEVMRATDPHGAAAALRGRARRPDYRPALAQLRIPSFVCAGTADGYSTPEITRALIECLHDPEVRLLPDVGHLPNLEHPSEFNSALEAFLTKVRRRA